MSSAASATCLGFGEAVEHAAHRALAPSRATAPACPGWRCACAPPAAGRMPAPRGCAPGSARAAIPCARRCGRSAGSSRARSRRWPPPAPARARRSSSSTSGSCTPSLSGCTPTLAQKLSCASASACTGRKLLQRGADAQRAVDLRRLHGAAQIRRCGRAVRESSGGNANRRTCGASVAAQSRDCQAGGATGSASAWTTRSIVPSISSILSFRPRVFSSAGKRTPTPWVRPPEALLGVIQATLPATG